MRWYRVPNYDFHNPQMRYMSENDIINFYWNHWSRRMREAGIPEEDITRENCIDQFVVANWAVETNISEVEENESG